MSAIFIVAAKRTPLGAFGGKLKSFSATQLGAVASRAALAAVKFTSAAAEAAAVAAAAASSSTSSSHAAGAAGASTPPAGGLPGALLDLTVFGNVAQTSADAAYLARHVGLLAVRRCCCAPPPTALLLLHC